MPHQLSPAQAQNGRPSARPTGTVHNKCRPGRPLFSALSSTLLTVDQLQDVFAGVDHVWPCSLRARTAPESAVRCASRVGLRSDSVRCESVPMLPRTGYPAALGHQCRPRSTGTRRGTSARRTDRRLVSVRRLPAQGRSIRPARRSIRWPRR
jgi:hypothetical protein